MFGIDHSIQQPVQLYQIGLRDLDCRLMGADPRLEGCVYYYWMLTVAAAEVRLPIVPDGAVDLVLSPGLPEFATVYAPRLKPFEIELSGPIVYFGACLAPAAAEVVLGRPVADLAVLGPGDPTIQSLDAAELVADMQGVADALSARTRFDRWFIRRADQWMEAPEITVLTQLMPLIESSSVEDMATHLGLSERQLRRVVARQAGLSPKQWARVVRLQRTLKEILFGGDGPWSGDYYDDSHRIRELKALTGLTPGQIRRMAEKYNSGR